MVSFVYTMVVTVRQQKKFISNLRIGDETNYGEINQIEGDYVVINRTPLKLHRSQIMPKEIKGNKFLLLK
jgi:hypothetical protein